MKRDGKYRYTLQFDSETNEQIRAGELLEKLGYRKSAVLVMALNEYLDNHPELEGDGGKIEVKVKPGYTHEELVKIITSVIEEKLGPKTSSEDSVVLISSLSSSQALEDDVSQMLQNLDFFNE